MCDPYILAVPEVQEARTGMNREPPSVRDNTEGGSGSAGMVGCS